ncbi:MAG: hypothetical protein FJX67_12695, partial [Alphaproteobacteria bacterium]|nr:hypothetical protein [Alphaproteobacteria bacterium]
MGREKRVAARVIGVGLVVGLAGGCTTMSDALDPGRWFEGRERPAAQPRAVSERVPGEDRPFPNLSTVPPRPQPTSPEARRQIAQGLSADRDNARYSEEVIRRQSDAGVPPPSRPIARSEPPSVASAALAAPAQQTSAPP